MKEDSYTWQEIISQPQTWRFTSEEFDKNKDSLSAFLESVEYKQILVIGCGSTYYLSQSVARTIAHYTGNPALAAPSSDLYFFPEMTAPEGTLLIAISRSGTTTETLWAMERFRKQIGGPVVMITCNPDKNLTKLADFVLVAPDAQELSIAQTRSFTSMLLLSQGLVSVLARDPKIWQQSLKLPGILEKIVQDLGKMPEEIGAELEISHFVFLGSGSLYGLANELMLKSKEIALTFSEAYHTLEVRHGPMSMINKNSLVVGFLTDTAQEEQRRVLRDMQDLGAKVLVVIEDSSALSELKPEYLVELNSGIGEWVRGPLYLPAIQRIAYHRAIAKGLDPDNPTNLEAVVKLQ